MRNLNEIRAVLIEREAAAPDVERVRRSVSRRTAEARSAGSAGSSPFSQPPRSRRRQVWLAGVGVAALVGTVAWVGAAIGTQPDSTAPQPGTVVAAPSTDPTSIGTTDGGAPTGPSVVPTAVAPTVTSPRPDYAAVPLTCATSVNQLIPDQGPVSIIVGYADRPHGGDPLVAPVTVDIINSTYATLTGRNDWDAFLVSDGRVVAVASAPPLLTKTGFTVEARQTRTVERSLIFIPCLGDTIPPGDYTATFVEHLDRDTAPRNGYSVTSEPFPIQVRTGPLTTWPHLVDDSAVATFEQNPVQISNALLRARFALVDGCVYGYLRDGRAFLPVFEAGSVAVRGDGLIIDGVPQAFGTPLVMTGADPSGRGVLANEGTLVPAACDDTVPAARVVDVAADPAAESTGSTG